MERTRQQQRAEDCWAIEDLYENDEAWEADYKKLEEKFQEFSRFEGVISENPTTLLELLKLQDQVGIAFERVYVYANQRYHEDTGNQTYQEFSARASRLAMLFDQAVAFVEPELMQIEEKRWDDFYREEPGLLLYKRKIQEYLRLKSHILSGEMEELLASAGEMAEAPSKIYSMFQNADLKLGTVVVDGKETVITQGNFVRLLEHKDRAVRKNVFQTVYAKYEEFQNTLAAIYSGNLAQEIFCKKARHYDSCLAMALDGGNIPVEVYTNLIEAVHRGLPSMYRYVDLRKQALGLEEFHMYDVYVPLSSDSDRKISYEEAKKMVKEGLKVLGDDYIALLEEGFTNRWIDVYENQGKRGGAYSWGAYGTHPYVLMNYQEDLNHVFTLAHEMGHALHSYYSDRKQPYAYASYRIFVAEVASTCNEALMIHDLLEKAASREEKIYLLNYFLDQFKGTIYRQTMFAEFEWKVHIRAEQGEALTAGTLSDMYYQLNQKYFGEAMISDPEIALEWARIPHFYTPFYVYQYATGFSAAIAISRKILNKEPGIVEAYKQFLSGGSSMDCIDLLKLCGVDMTSTAPVEEALQVFEEHVEKLRNLLLDETK